ncbi:MAG: hypothetical protein QXK12_04165 [Candidatus Nezhaarchaeales archaeon]
MFKASFHLPLLHVMNLTLLLLGINMVAWYYRQQILESLITREILNKNPSFDRGLAEWRVEQLPIKGLGGTPAFEVEYVEDDGKPPPAIRVRSSTTSCGVLSLYQPVNLSPLDLTSPFLTRIVLEASIKRESGFGLVAARVIDVTGNVLYDQVLLEQFEGLTEWRDFSIDITPKTQIYAGQTIKLYLTLYDPSCDEEAAWIIDNVTISVIYIQNLVVLTVIVASGAITLIAAYRRIKVGV